jgi:hypothetical protein
VTDHEIREHLARLLGWTWDERCARRPDGSRCARVKDERGNGPDDPWWWLPDPLNDDADADAVLDRIAEGDEEGVNCVDLSCYNGDWTCTVLPYSYAKNCDDYDWRDSPNAVHGRVDAIGQTTSGERRRRAICLAALRSAGVEPVS